MWNKVGSHIWTRSNIPPEVTSFDLHRLQLDSNPEQHRRINVDDSQRRNNERPEPGEAHYQRTKALLFVNLHNAFNQKKRLVYSLVAEQRNHRAASLKCTSSIDRGVDERRGQAYRWVALHRDQQPRVAYHCCTNHGAHRLNRTIWMASSRRGLLDF